MSELDHIDQLAASSLDGYLVRKDLVRTFSKHKRQVRKPLQTLSYQLSNLKLSFRVSFSHEHF
jgi:hypothetical protein